MMMIASIYAFFLKIKAPGGLLPRRARLGLKSDFNHFEIALGYAAIRA
jgi:hypothetical protein